MYYTTRAFFWTVLSTKILQSVGLILRCKSDFYKRASFKIQTSLFSGNLNVNTESIVFFFQSPRSFNKSKIVSVIYYPGIEALIFAIGKFFCFLILPKENWFILQQQQCSRQLSLVLPYLLVGWRV